MQKTDMTAAEKIAAIEQAGWPLAWDGCHKIYFLQDDERFEQARDFGYDIYRSNKLRECIEASCSLVFVSRWGFNNDDFEHPFNIPQFDRDLWLLMGWPVDDEDEED